MTPKELTKPAFLPWSVVKLGDGRIAIANWIGDTVCKTEDAANSFDERDFYCIVEMANARQE